MITPTDFMRFPVTVDVSCTMPWPLKQRYTDIVRVVCTHTTEAGDTTPKES